MATRAGRGRIFVTSFNSLTLKTACWTQRSPRSRIQPSYGRFVPNFVAMATGVGCGKICLASFNSPTPKTPCYTQRSPGYLLHKPSLADFVPNFVAMATGVGLGRIFFIRKDPGISLI